MPDLAMAATLDEALRRATAALARAGMRDARREARELVAAVLGTTPGALWLVGGTTLDAATAERVTAAVTARASGEPAAHAAGVQAFRRLDLVADARALIPRPETEGLVDLVLEWAGRRWGEAPWGDVVDVGTGSGCVALALATEGRFRRVIAIERSSTALALAQENVARVGPPGVELQHGDLLAPLAGQRVDAVVSNPPYLTEAEYAALDPAVRDHEPREALVGGRDGLAVTERLLDEARGVVRPHGVLALEVDARRARRVARCARQLGWRDVWLADDLFGRPRYVLAGSRWR